MTKLTTNEEIQQAFDNGCLFYRHYKVLELTLRAHMFQKGVIFIGEKGWVDIYGDAINEGLFTSR